MAVMKRATISAINFEVLPLSSLIVIGLSSLILSKAAGASSLYFAIKVSAVGNSSPCTCLKAALYWTSSFEQLPVYSLFFTLSLMYAFFKALECVDHCKEFCQVVNL